MGQLSLARIFYLIVRHEIATEEELNLIIAMNGYSLETLNAVIYERTGYRDIEQLWKEEN